MNGSFILRGNEGFSTDPRSLAHDYSEIGDWALGGERGAGGPQD